MIYSNPSFSFTVFRFEYLMKEFGSMYFIDGGVENSFISYIT